MVKYTKDHEGARRGSAVGERGGAWRRCQAGEILRCAQNDRRGALRMTDVRCQRDVSLPRGGGRDYTFGNPHLCPSVRICGQEACMKFADRIEKLPPYLFAQISKKVAAKKAEGIDVVSFGI